MPIFGAMGCAYRAGMAIASHAILQNRVQDDDCQQNSISAHNLLPVVGCETVLVAPTSKDELLQDRLRAQFCYTESVGIIEARARDFFKNCYQSKSANAIVPVGNLLVRIPNSATYLINEESIPSGTRFVVKNTDLGSYIVAAEVRGEGGGDCSTTLVAFSGNSGSKTFFPDAISKYTHGQSLECPFNTKH